MDATNKSLVNRVANSGLITINLEDYFPAEQVVAFDIKDYLYKGLILKEKEFRAALKAYDWTAYSGKHLAVYCSTDAIVPVWAYMLITANAEPHALSVFQGNVDAFYQYAFYKALEKLDTEQFAEKRIVIKGCNNKPVPASAYMELTRKLRPFAQSIMYGEPCSTVPIFKKPRNLSQRKK